MLELKDEEELVVAGEEYAVGATEVVFAGTL